MAFDLSRAGRRGGLALFLTVLLTAIGCGGKPPMGTEPTRNDTAEDVARMLKTFAEEKNRPPAGLGDLAGMDGPHPLGYPAVARGEYVLFYKVPLATGPEAAKTVLGYHKDAPTQGGLVIMQDGSLQTLSTAEFQSARKAGK